MLRRQQQQQQQQTEITQLRFIALLLSHFYYIHTLIQAYPYTRTHFIILGINIYLFQTDKKRVKISSAPQLVWNLYFLMQANYYEHMN